MKVRVTTLDFNKKNGYFNPSIWYIVETKKHWYSRWKYVIDDSTGCPKLYKYKDDIVKEFNLQPLHL